MSRAGAAGFERLHVARALQSSVAMKNRPFAFPILLSTLIAAGVWLDPGPAFADRTSHGGGTCIEWGGGGTEFRNNQGVLGNGHYSNWLDVFCPVARSTGKNTPGVPLVHVIDRNQGQGVTCSFYDVEAYGDEWQWGDWKESSGDGPDNYKTMSWPSEGNSWDKFEGFHHFYCKIPPRQNHIDSSGVSYLSSYSSGE